MSRLVSEHFRPDGRPKMKFVSMDAAKKYIQKQQVNCRPYRCSFCGYVHIATIK